MRAADFSIDANAVIGGGVYSVSEVSRLARLTPAKVRRWLSGYNYTYKNERREQQPLWTPDLIALTGHLELNFKDLIELRFVKSFNDLGIGLQAIRSSLKNAQDILESDHPFLTGQFRSDGATIFLESADANGDKKLIDLKDRQFVLRDVIEQSFKDLDLEEGIVARWRPFRGKRSIVIDPVRSFGAPIATEYGVPTATLSDAVRSEGSLKSVSRLYDVPEGVVRDAVNFEETLRAA
ncbi:hypothetical protein [Roseobacter sp. HKCCA0434]|uniref:hypothetical protein n=1 Tax=Roseobacter sp. HKCCA0434 TaxID=3079297 RepID=UPI002905A7B4|nr:hypothetical protein [Roseobacter sp. HKCCA0434]